MDEDGYQPFRPLGLSLGKQGCVGLIALIGLMVLFWTTAGSQSRAVTRERFEAALVDEVIPAQTIALRGHIALKGFRIDHTRDESVEQEQGNTRIYRAECEAMCAALLAMPEVESVTTILSTQGRSTATRFQLVSQSECPRPSVLPDNPDALRSHLRLAEGRKEPQLTHRERMQAGIVAARSLMDAWRVRLSNKECIIAERVTAANAALPADFTIETVTAASSRRYIDPEKWKWTFDQRPLSDWRLVIRDANGDLLLRRQFVSVPILTKPVRPGFVASCGKLCMYVGWARTPLANFDLDDEKNTRALILAYTDIARGLDLAAFPENSQGDTVEDALRAALNDPVRPASDPVFALADSWMRSLTSADLGDDDVTLLIQMIQDTRVVRFQGVYHATDALAGRIGELREPIRQRIARDPERESVVKPLAAQIAKITISESPQTLAKGVDEADLAILQDPEKRLYARGMIVAQAAYGARSLPLLMDIMRHHAAANEAPGAKGGGHIGVMDSTMVALCRMGLEAKPALPELFSMPSTWLQEELAADSNYHFMLARMGQPLNTLRKPEGYTRLSQADYEGLLRTKMKRGGAERCRGNWM
ncbi:MAG: hypothetical protein AAGK17_13625 [Pseudomonadota bacterium]